MAVGGGPAGELVMQRLCLALGAVAALDGLAAVDAMVSRGLLQVGRWERWSGFL